jgi:hypothetical protein
MNCYLSSILGLGLLGGSIATMTVTKEQHNNLKDVFSDDLDKKYDEIITERRNHYLIGLIVGAIISIIVIKNIININYYTRITLFLAITLGTAVLLYMVLPKSDYMLNHLKTAEENKKWLDVYKTMKSRYYIGFVLGIIGALLLGSVFC